MRSEPPSVLQWATSSHFRTPAASPPCYRRPDPAERVVTNNRPISTNSIVPPIAYPAGNVACQIDLTGHRVHELCDSSNPWCARIPADPVLKTRVGETPPGVRISLSASLLRVLVNSIAPPTSWCQQHVTRR